MTVDVDARDPDSASRRHLGDHRRPGPFVLRAYHPTAIVTGNVVSQYLRHGSPVAGREARLEALGHCWPRFPAAAAAAEFVEAGERGVEIVLVENLVAVDEIAVDYEEAQLNAIRRRTLLVTSLSPDGW